MPSLPQALLAAAALLLAAPGAQALAVGVAGVGVDAGLSPAGPSAGVDAPGVGAVQVETPLPSLGQPVPSLPSLSLQVPAAGLSMGTEAVDGEAPSHTSSSRATFPQRLADVPPEVAVPAAGGLVAVIVAVWAWLSGGLGAAAASLPFVGRLFSRIDGPRVLEHPMRARLNELVASSPGLGTEQLRAAAGIAWGTAVHHLRRLERNGLVVTQRQGGRLLHFPANSEASRHRASLADLSGPTARRIASLVSGRPGLAQADVCMALGLRGPAVSKHLGRLASRGLVEVRPDGRQRRYLATEQLQLALAAAAV